MELLQRPVRRGPKPFSPLIHPNSVMLLGHGRVKTAKTRLGMGTGQAQIECYSGSEHRRIGVAVDHNGIDVGGAQSRTQRSSILAALHPRAVKIRPQTELRPKRVVHARVVMLPCMRNPILAPSARNGVHQRLQLDKLGPCAHDMRNSVGG